jgi:hypothetical protein
MGDVIELHHGQHANCRACGTSPRQIGRQGARERHATARPVPQGRRTPPTLARRLVGAADCGECGGSGWVPVNPDTGEIDTAQVWPCQCRRVPP